MPGCKGYACMRPASVVPFATEAEAQQAGYRRAKGLSIRDKGKGREYNLRSHALPTK